MSNSTNTNVLAAGILAVSAGFAAAVCVAPCGTTGWNYGGVNCGWQDTDTALECKQCCLDGVNSGSITGTDLLDCEIFCGQVDFGPYNAHPGFWETVASPSLWFDYSGWF
ncbi:MAG: hypothetical protein ACSHX5_06565 [Phycisphaerales bacterium]